MKAMSLDAELLKILVCPQDKQPLDYDEAAGVLINPRRGVAYPIDGDIPVLLIDEAKPWPPATEA